ncbi:S-adenosylmethionine-dependent methyltransferase [Litorivivens lipolytica]|uniref:S-adenosylmethionine-dependent methyltransferase n=1 Tax=Litorivivens lipolytica TaxID=1524264 RepID=A0A7W4Z5W6_9GAMM|nr:methyltransferase domain-containing protein [Litorivivens lipolytica]MBB3047552.1 S-adenosylmethionine-dependent methyltransferase [Litorivivens lipolytica]
MTGDHVFSGRAERFRERIYGSAKGELRLELVWRDMLEQLPLQQGALDCWDAGGGLGQISQRLAKLGHRIVLSEPAEDMLALARAALPEAVDCRQETLQQHLSQARQYDLIVCHAVLEWLAEPLEAVAAMASALQPGGYLSLLVYNVHAIAINNMIKGNLRKVAAEKFAGESGSFTPPSPQEPARLVTVLEQLGLEVCSRRSMRFALDFMPRAVRAERSLEDVMAVEWQFGNREPYWQLGRYVHLVCRCPD